VASELSRSLPCPAARPVALQPDVQMPQFSLDSLRICPHWHAPSVQPVARRRVELVSGSRLVEETIIYRERHEPPPCQTLPLSSSCSCRNSSSRRHESGSPQADFRPPPWVHRRQAVARNHTAHFSGPSHTGSLCSFRYLRFIFGFIGITDVRFIQA